MRFIQNAFNFLESSNKGGTEVQKMKQLVIVVALCVVLSVQGLTDDQKAKIKQYYGECIASTGVDKVLVDDAEKGNIANDPKLKEFASCFFKKAGIQNEAGEIQGDVLKQKLSADYSESEIDAVLAKCKSNKGTPGDIASSFWECYWKTATKHVPLV